MMDWRGNITRQWISDTTWKSSSRTIQISSYVLTESPGWTWRRRRQERCCHGTWSRWCWEAECWSSCRPNRAGSCRATPRRYWTTKQRRWGEQEAAGHQADPQHQSAAQTVWLPPLLCVCFFNFTSSSSNKSSAIMCWRLLCDCVTAESCLPCSSKEELCESRPSASVVKPEIWPRDICSTVDTKWSNRHLIECLTGCKATFFLPGVDVGLQICSCLRGQGGVTGDVQENKVKGNKVSDEPQQHHWVPPKPVALVQHPKHAPSWRDSTDRGRKSQWAAASWLCSGRVLVVSAVMWQSESNEDSPKISPMPMQIPEMPMRLFASLPKRVMAPIHVPYTPL